MHIGCYTKSKAGKQIKKSWLAKKISVRTCLFHNIYIKCIKIENTGEAAEGKKALVAAIM